jgi:hypothetical protein
VQVTNGVHGRAGGSFRFGAGSTAAHRVPVVRRRDLVRVAACRVAVDRGGGDQLVRLCLGDERFETFAHSTPARFCVAPRG